MMETAGSSEKQIYLAKPKELDPHRVSEALGNWKVYSWTDGGYRFESPHVVGLPDLEMVISEKEFILQPSNWRQADPRVYLRNISRIEIRGRELGITTRDGSCYVWLQGLKARILTGKKLNGRQAELSVSFGNPV